jgi:hypothetical protein
MPSGENAAPMMKRPAIRNKAERFFSIYTNSVQLEMTPWDLKFLFGTMTEATEQRLVVEDSCEVFMSPQHAKVLATLLVNNLKQYEDRFGKIPGPARGPAEIPQEPT